MKLTMIKPCKLEQPTWKNSPDGTIAVIGPKRMDYGRIVSLLEYVDEKLDSRKEKDGKN